MLLPLLTAVLSGLSFAAAQVVLKHVLVKEAPPYLAPSWLAFLLPFWLIAFWLTWQMGWLEYRLDWEALRWPLVWAGCVVVSLTGLAYLLMRFSLSELLGYKKALITLGAGVMDVTVFDTPLPVTTITAVTVILCGTLMLSRTRAEDRVARKLTARPSLVQVVVLLLWCLLLVAQFSLYKAGLVYQRDVLAYVVIAQAMVAMVYACLWLHPRVRRQQVPWKGAGLFVLCILCGVLLEGFAYRALPLAVILVVTMLPASLMAAHDIWRGDLPKSRATLLALGVLLLGFVMLMGGR